MPEAIVEALSRFFNRSEYPIAFTGAGVSARAGLPAWKGLTEKLAEGLRSKDSLTTQLMLECVNDGDFTRAYDYFRLSKKMLEGDKQNLLVRLLSGYESSPLASFAQLPCRACLTTNFDRSVHDAFAVATGIAARDYRFGDQSFKQAQWDENFFVARIHGAIEIPESVVLSEQQFQELLKSDVYADLLGAMFMRRNLLFIGFSFYDPAIRHVLSELNKKVGAAPPGRHMALIPFNVQSEFLQRANRLNIEIVQYDPANDHEALWAGMAKYVQESGPTADHVMPTGPLPFDSTKRFLAACYARAKTSHGSMALRTAVIEGIISAILQEAAPHAITRRELVEKIRVVIGLHGKPALAIVDDALKSLCEAGLSRKHKQDTGRGVAFSWISAPTPKDSLANAMDVLKTSLRNRAFLQEGWTISAEVETAIHDFFSQIIIRRGWDLGAAFAASRVPEGVAIEALLRECTTGLRTFDQQRLLVVCQSMFQRPSYEEAAILGDLGRVSFALELAFQSPRSVLLHKAILPRRLYFDASVVLPMLVDGHPLSAAYVGSIDKLQAAATRAAVGIEFNICTAYLNEVISHRANALAYSEQVGAQFADVVRSDALYHGVSNVNVFVGGYANWIINHEHITFAEYLRRCAPYETETELGQWLVKKGFKVVNAVKGPKYGYLYSLLESAYSGSLARGKGPILIEHDAMQLSMLAEEGEKSESTLFVTADRKLQSAVANCKYPWIADMMISHVALVQFIELLIGGVADGAALTELLWNSRVSDGSQAIRSFFIALGLEQYDDGMAMAMPEIVDQFSETASSALRRAGADLDAESPTGRASAFRILGSLEKDYLAGMSAAVEKLRKDMSTD